MQANKKHSPDEFHNKRITGIGFVLISAVLLATAPNAAKIAYQEGANPQAVITIRTVIGVVLLALYLFARGQWPAQMWAIVKRSPFSGLTFLLGSVGFMGAVAFIDVSLTVMIFYLHTFLVAVVGHFRGDVILNLRLISLIALALVGLGLVLGVTLDTLNPAGVGLSIVGMVGAAFMIVLVAEQARTVGPIAANFIMSGWASIYLLIAIVFGPMLGLFGGIVFPQTLFGWVCVLAAGVTITLGFVTFFIGARLIGTTRAVMLSIFEPIFAIALAIIFVNEWLNLTQWIGAVIIVGSLYLFEVTSSADAKTGETAH